MAETGELTEANITMISLDEMSGDFAGFIRRMEKGELVIRDGGKILGVFVRLDSEGQFDLEDSLLIRAPKLLEHLTQVNAQIASGDYVTFEQFDWR